MYLIYNVSYLFMVLFLAIFVLLLMLVYCANSMYVKYLVVLVYLSGIVIFILYISCLCWYSVVSSQWSLVIFGLVIMVLYDIGSVNQIHDVGEYLWMFFFFSLIFANLVNIYSLLLFKVAGSLRF